MGDVVEILRFEVFQGQIFQLALNGVKTQLVGNLCVEVHRLPALLAALLGREDIERTHHLEAVGQLDQDHTRILRVAYDQVAEVLGLLLGHLELEARDVGHADRDTHHLLPKAGANLLREREELLGGELLVPHAHHIVQNRGDRGVAPQTDLLDDDLRHLYGVIQHRATVITHCATELLGSVYQRLVHQRGGLLREGFAD